MPHCMYCTRIVIYVEPVDRFIDGSRETMITFTSFPKPKDPFAYAPSKFPTEGGSDMDVDFYEDGDGEDFDSGTKLTFPGEPITSSHAYMRCVLLYR